MNPQNPLSKNGKAILWTRQHEHSLNDLKTEGVFRIKYNYLYENYHDITTYYTKLYKWFVAEASSMVPKPEKVEYPIWCSVSPENTLPAIEGTVVYELEIDESEVIYFDGSKWDYVLNHHYVAKNPEDLKKYQEEMYIKGFKGLDLFSLVDGPKGKLYPDERDKVIKSWIRVFDIDSWDVFKVQGNIWEFNENHIKKIIYP